MFGKKKKNKNTKDVDAFNSKTSGNGKVNDNFILNKVRKNQLNPKNKSQTSTFIKRQQRLKDALDKLK
tara:strand:+ start:469 stop:672 length:204 start_codon:yes stop_codon:yes gene_type:complete